MPYVAIRGRPVQTSLQGQVAWITGAGSGIGEATAYALADAGAVVALTGRTTAKLDAVANAIRAKGGRAFVVAADVGDSAVVHDAARRIEIETGRIDILVNNAGLNIAERRWTQLTSANVDKLVQTNLASAFHCALAVLPIMRRQKNGLMIHTSSMSGRFVTPLSGATYTATKHGVVAMSHSLNLEECMNGIRSTVFCPGEVATPILDERPTPPSPEARAKMLQPADCADLIRYVACLPPHVCMNEVLLTPTWNRGYVMQMNNVLS
jgi:NADP-dependent 3-hydroxy acid dehydrogenase YdfG